MKLSLSPQIKDQSCTLWFNAKIIIIKQVNNTRRANTLPITQNPHPSFYEFYNWVHICVHTCTHSHPSQKAHTEPGVVHCITFTTGGLWERSSEGCPHCTFKPWPLTSSGRVHWSPETICEQSNLIQFTIILPPDPTQTPHRYSYWCNTFFLSSSLQQLVYNERKMINFPP